MNISQPRGRTLSIVLLARFIEPGVLRTGRVRTLPSDKWYYETSLRSAYMYITLVFYSSTGSSNDKHLGEYVLSMRLEIRRVL